MFLDYAPDETNVEDTTSHYPRTALGDFSLAVYTHDEDLDRNPVHYWNKGTNHYKAPEQVGFSAHWNRPATGFQKRQRMGAPFSTQAQAHQQQQDDMLGCASRGMADDRRDIYFDGAVKVWGLAKVIYELMTLDGGSALSLKYPDAEVAFDPLDPDNDNPVFPFDNSEDMQYYSKELKTLVRQCLHPDMTKRPDSSILFQETAAYLEAWKQRIYDQRGEDKTQRVPEEIVYFAKNDINALPLGPRNFAESEDQAQWIRDPEFLDPDWPPHIIPEGKKWDFWRTMYWPPQESAPRRPQDGGNGPAGPEAEEEADLQPDPQADTLLHPQPDFQRGPQPGSQPQPQPDPQPDPQLPEEDQEEDREEHQPAEVPLPTRAQYEAINYKDLIDELENERNVPAKVGKVKKKRMTKKQVINALLKADEDKNLGQGNWKQGRRLASAPAVIGAPAPPAPPAPVQQGGNNPQDPLPTYAEYNQHHINDQRIELRARGLPAGGSAKDPLVNALLEADGKGNRGNNEWKYKPVLKGKRKRGE